MANRIRRMVSPTPCNTESVAVPAFADCPAGVTLRRSRDALHLHSDRPLQVLSSAVVGGGFGVTRDVLNLRVPLSYAGDRPEQELAEAAARLGICAPFVGLMTAADLDRAYVAAAACQGIRGIAVITLGLGNRVAAGREQPVTAGVGTINAIFVLEAAVEPAALVNAVITATEAKALALVDAGVRTAAGHRAGGTSSDAVVVTATGHGPPVRFAGPVTPAGCLIAGFMRSAVLEFLGGSACDAS